VLFVKRARQVRDELRQAADDEPERGAGGADKASRDALAMRAVMPVVRRSKSHQLVGRHFLFRKRRFQRRLLQRSWPNTKKKHRIRRLCGGWVEWGTLLT